jgi:uncharacterized membrane protein YoaK (UPF0700 family)
MTGSGDTTRVQSMLAALLALVSGYVDAYSLLTYKVYASFMSGNTTLTGLNAGQGRLAEAVHDLLPVPLFVTGIFAGTFLIQGRLRRPLRLLCGLVAALLAAGFAAALIDPSPGWVSISLLSVAMGVVNTTVTHVGDQAVSLGFVTGDLNNLGRHLALAAKGMPVADARGPRDTHGRRAALLAVVWGSFLVGALLAGAAMTFIGNWTLLPPLLVLLALAVCDRGTSDQSKQVGSK